MKNQLNSYQPREMSGSAVNARVCPAENYSSWVIRAPTSVLSLSGRMSARKHLNHDVWGVGSEDAVEHLVGGNRQCHEQPDLGTHRGRGGCQLSDDLVDGLFRQLRPVPLGEVARQFGRDGTH